MPGLAIGDCPQWVDRAYPSDLLIEQYNWHGAYAGGFLNSIFGQQGVVQTTPGTDGMQGYNYIAKDDDVWVYTGVTSATSDNSIVGFVLVNQRTAEAHFYSVSGATEDRAMRSAEGAVQDLGYNATFPILINVSDRPTYFMSLKDGEGTVKQFAMVDIQSYQKRCGRHDGGGMPEVVRGAACVGGRDLCGQFAEHRDGVRDGHDRDHGRSGHRGQLALLRDARRGRPASSTARCRACCLS